MWSVGLNRRLWQVLMGCKQDFKALIVSHWLKHLLIGQELILVLRLSHWLNGPLIGQ